MNKTIALLFFILFNSSTLLTSCCEELTVQWGKNNIFSATMIAPKNIDDNIYRLAQSLQIQTDWLTKPSKKVTDKDNKRLSHLLIEIQKQVKLKKMFLIIRCTSNKNSSKNPINAHGINGNTWTNNTHFPFLIIVIPHRYLQYDNAMLKSIIVHEIGHLLHTFNKKNLALKKAKKIILLIDYLPSQIQTKFFEINLIKHLIFDTFVAISSSCWLINLLKPIKN